MAEGESGRPLTRSEPEMQEEGKRHFLQKFLEGLADLTLDTGVHIEGQIVQVIPPDVHPEIGYRIMTDGVTVYPITLEEWEAMEAEEKRLNELRSEMQAIEAARAADGGLNRLSRIIGTAQSVSHAEAMEYHETGILEERSQTHSEAAGAAQEQPNGGSWGDDGWEVPDEPA